MNRLTLMSAAKRAAAPVALTLVMAAVPGVAAAQATTPPAAAAPAQEVDVMKFTTATPAVIVMQIDADKTADFEAAWAAIRAAAAKGDADAKAYGESLAKLSKVDQPPLDAGGRKSALYILQLDTPSTVHSYHVAKFLWEVLWGNGKPDAILKREEADAIFEKLKVSVVNINPPWKLVKIGG
jgi:hypothetical protein